MEYLEILYDNLGLIGGYILAIIAGFDKVALITIKTISNVRDAWYDSFPKKYKD
jgi:hypothetical protein